MTVDCCNTCIENEKKTSNEFFILEDQLSKAWAKSDELEKEVTQVMNKLAKERKYTECLHKENEVVGKELELARSHLEGQRLKYQGLEKEYNSLKAYSTNLTDEQRILDLNHKAEVQNLLAKLKKLQFKLEAGLQEYKLLLHQCENHLTRHCCIPKAFAVKALSIDTEDQNQILLLVTDALSQQRDSTLTTVQNNDDDAFDFLDVDNHPKRLKEELEDSFERERVYDEQDEALRERERRCAEKEQRLENQEKEQEQRSMEQEQSLKQQRQSIIKQRQSLQSLLVKQVQLEQISLKQEKSYKQQDWTLRGRVKGCNEKEDEITKSDQLNTFGKRKINFSILPVPKEQRAIKRRCTSWQIQAAEYLKEELVSAWLLNPWTFWSPGEGSYRTCIKATVINKGRKDPPLERMRLMVAYLWLGWEKNQQAEFDNIDAKSFRFGSQVKQNLDIGYALHMSFAPQKR